MSLSLSRSSALNLELEGSVGSFSVGRGAQNTIDVKYFLTHVGLDLEAASNAEALKHLAPVREIFEPESLEFDEIMQRDIDDARVSSELIPYLLDHKSRDLVKLFPPIVVVVLPTKIDENRPEALYPAVEEITQLAGQAGRTNDTLVTRSGIVGQEVFQFEQPVLDGRVLEHDLTRLKLNTNRCKLVIVDGQHRAMALLALYRNIKQEWGDARRAPFKDYYEEWTPAYIRQFNLKRITIPMMLCTFPTLDSTYKGDYDLKKAARTIFLTLNKTARRVSESRNRLLDDNDLIAWFLRDTLSIIKKKDVLSQYSLRIFNIELDQVHNRTKLDTPIALTGVNHVYYLIEHLILNKYEDVNGARPRAGRYSTRRDMEMFGGWERLNARNKLGADVANATSREIFTVDAAQKLTEQFKSRFGEKIVKTYEEFEPFEFHNRAALWLEEHLSTLANNKLRPILFEGQGIGRVFDTHRQYLKERLSNGDFGAEATKIKEVITRLDGTHTSIDKLIKSFADKRAINFLEGINGKKALQKGDGAFLPEAISFVNDLYENVFRTVAFQTAMFAGFFSELEAANRKRKLSGNTAIVGDAEFQEYLSQLSAFFAPKTLPQFRRLVKLFAGTLDEDAEGWKLAPSPYTFRQVVYRGEMQPDQWPKYKYLLLEIWKPTEPTLASAVIEAREHCRDQIFSTLREHYKNEYLKKNVKREETLDDAEQLEIVKSAYEALFHFLNNVGWNQRDIPTRPQLVDRASIVVDTTETAPEDEEVWGSEQVVGNPES